MAGPLALFLSLGASYALSESVPNPSVNVQPTAAVFSSPTDVEVRVTLENRGRPCLPLMVDPSLFPITSPHRPHVVVTFTILTEDGKRLEATGKVKSTPRGLRATDVFVLDCKAIYGRYIALSGGEWDYPLKRGRYRIRAKVTSTLGTFVQSRPELLEKLHKETQIPVSTLRQVLRDFTAESEEASFEVSTD